MKEVVERLKTISHSLKPYTNSDPCIKKEKEITTLLIPHDREQGLELNKLLNEFSELADKKGFSLKLAGNTKIS